MKQSGFLSLGARDILRGLAMAVLTPVVAIITDSIERGELNFNWRLIAISAIGGGMAYLVKNFFTPKDTQSIGGGGIQNPPKP
jgi:hypothetical protein